VTIQAHDGVIRVVRLLVEVKHWLHLTDKRGALLGRNHPLLRAMKRLEFVFFSSRATIVVEMCATTSNSTSRSASRRSCQRDCSLGGLYFESCNIPSATPAFQLDYLNMTLPLNAESASFLNKFKLTLTEAETEVALARQELLTAALNTAEFAGMVRATFPSLPQR